MVMFLLLVLFMDLIILLLVCYSGVVKCIVICVWLCWCCLVGGGVCV